MYVEGGKQCCGRKAIWASCVIMSAGAGGGEGEQEEEKMRMGPKGKVRKGEVF